MKPHSPRHFAFGPFVLDGLRGVLWEGSTPIPLTTKAFNVLQVLIEHQGEALDKDEIMRLVWGDQVVEENNLARHISTLRRALGALPHQLLVGEGDLDALFVEAPFQAPAKLAGHVPLL